MANALAFKRMVDSTSLRTTIPPQAIRDTTPDPAGVLQPFSEADPGVPLRPAHPSLRNLLRGYLMAQASRASYLRFTMTKRPSASAFWRGLLVPSGSREFTCTRKK